jgi:hypothetical protein
MFAPAYMGRKRRGEALGEAPPKLSLHQPAIYPLHFYKEWLTFFV